MGAVHNAASNFMRLSTIPTRHAREELGYVAAMPIEETVRSVELESW